MDQDPVHKIKTRTKYIKSGIWSTYIKFRPVPVHKLGDNCIVFVYVPTSSTKFNRILIYVIFRPRDMQEYIFMFSIALEWRYAFDSYLYLDMSRSFNEKNCLYLDISRPFECPKCSPVVCLICYYLRLVVLTTRLRWPHY
jgi:hypothetical protein